MDNKEAIYDCKNLCGVKLTEELRLRNDGFCGYECKSDYEWDKKKYDNPYNAPDPRFRKTMDTLESTQFGFRDQMTSSDWKRNAERAKAATEMFDIRNARDNA